MGMKCQFKFGEWVDCSYTVGYQEYLVIGEPDYTDGGHVVLSDAEAIGMPISVGHCSSIGATNVELAIALRERYLMSFPGKLKELP